MVRLTDFEKHHTVAGAESAKALRFAASAAANTAAVFLVVFGRIDGYPRGLAGVREIFGGVYTGFTRGCARARPPPPPRAAPRAAPAGRMRAHAPARNPPPHPTPPHPTPTPPRANRVR